MKPYFHIQPISRTKELKLIDSNLFSIISNMHKIKDYYNEYRLVNYFAFKNNNKQLSKHYSIDFIICELVNGLYKIFVFEELLISKYIIIDIDPNDIIQTKISNIQETIIEYPNKRQSIFIIEINDEEIYENELVLEDDINVLPIKLPIIDDNNEKESVKLTKEDILNRMVYTEGKLKGKGINVLKEDTRFIYDLWKI